MHSIRVVLLSIVSLFMAACGQSGTYYEKSPDEIAKAIEGATLATVGDRRLVGSEVTRPSANMVVTAAKDQLGGDVFRIITKLTPDGDGTYVETHFEQVGKRKGHDENMAQLFAAEHVTAAIEGRSFDMMFASNPAAKAIIEQNPEAARRMKASGEAMVAFSKMEQDAAKQEQHERFEKQYGSDWGASPSKAQDGWGADGEERNRFSSAKDGWGD